MRVSEVYASAQGEGPNVGRTTIFVRFGGCNLRCPGWPCDTQHAIDIKYRDDWERLTPEELFARTVEVAQLAGTSLITLTGGEPFLQNAKELHRYVSLLVGMGYEIEAFSNGTLPYPDWAIQNISFIMDWKLPGSGEDHMNKNRLDNLKWLAESPKLQSVKFVCKTIDDFHVAASLWFSYVEDLPVRVYYGRVWDGEIQNDTLVELIMKHKLPWYLNVQMHNYIWDPQERGR